MTETAYGNYLIIGRGDTWRIQENFGNYRLSKIHFNSEKDAKIHIDKMTLDDSLKGIGVDIRIVRNAKNKAWTIWDKDSDAIVSFDDFDNLVPYIKGLIS